MTYADPDSIVESGPTSAAWILIPESGPPLAARLPAPAAIFTDASDDLKNKMVKINYKYYKQTAESAALKTRANLRKMLQNCSINLPNF